MHQSSLDTLMSKVKKGQMDRTEYEYIANLLGGKNFLVFGTGHDSVFWREVNNFGTTVFLEHDPKWVLEKSSDVFLVKYTCNIKNHKTLLEEYKNNIYTNLELKFPEEVYKHNWDVIFVDGPPGNKKNSIGRMQSIYMANKLANMNTQIFVHDCNRPVEDIYTKEFFNIQHELVKLRHCRKKQCSTQ